MRIDRHSSTAIEVTLSRRNLRTLLAKLDGHPVDSAVTIFLPPWGDEPTLVVRAEEDAIHYAHSDRHGVPAGRMHPDTEEAL